MISVHGNTDIPISGIAIDSRKVEQGYLFIALKGTASDGHKFINQVIQKNAAAVICEQEYLADIANTAIIVVRDSAQAAGIAAHTYFNAPSHQFKLIGVTGTNGKTTIATLLFHLFEQLGFKAGLISTVENKIHQHIIPSTHTTPDAVQLNQLLSEMAEADCDYVFMEVSSHAAVQKRIAGLHFTGAIFSNISHDHLDYHKTFDAYIAAKKSFFDNLSSEAFALINIDDKRGKIMLQNCEAATHTYSVTSQADFTCRIIENNITGLILKIDQSEFHSRLVGEFNAWNILAVYAAARLLGFEKENILTTLSKLSPVEGRFDVVYSSQKNITGVIDYAHTPDAVEKILTTIRNSLRAHQKIITVIGCGGDRDKTKRPVMAKVAGTLSDKLILTSDNPRSEDPLQIISEMKEGITDELAKKTISISDRTEAIKTAIMLAQSQDIVLIAGKGHEKYQEIKGIKYPFDDKQVLTETFKTLAS